MTANYEITRKLRSLPGEGLSSTHSYKKKINLSFLGKFSENCRGSQRVKSYENYQQLLLYNFMLKVKDQNGTLPAVYTDGFKSQSCGYLT